MKIFAALLLLLPGIAEANIVTFDFEYLPDSAGCSEPTSSHQNDSTYDNLPCDQSFIDANFKTGQQGHFVDTQGGITMNLSDPFPTVYAGNTLNSGSNSIWANGQVLCGNSLFCGDFVAEFDTAISMATVLFDGVGTPDSPYGDYDSDTFSYSIKAFDNQGILIGMASINDIPALLANTPFSLSIYGAGIRSLHIAGTVMTTGVIPNNLARLESITVVPEPPAIALLLLGLMFTGRRWMRGSTA